MLKYKGHKKMQGSFKSPAGHCISFMNLKKRWLCFFNKHRNTLIHISVLYVQYNLIVELYDAHFFSMQMGRGHEIKFFVTHLLWRSCIWF